VSVEKDAMALLARMAEEDPDVYVTLIKLIGVGFRWDTTEGYALAMEWAMRAYRKGVEDERRRWMDATTWPAPAAAAADPAPPTEAHENAAVGAEAGDDGGA